VQKKDSDNAVPVVGDDGTGQPEHKTDIPTKTKNPKPSAGSSAKGSLVYVSRVIDGDTIEVSLQGTMDIRLIGIDTPETVHPSEPVECFGPAASHYTTQALEGERVRLEFDVERMDRYGRTLAYVWYGGQLFNKVLVKRGLAVITPYPPNVKYVERFTSAQRSARQASQGLWGACSTGGKDEPGNDSRGVGIGNCTDGYSPCLPPASDYDCAGGSGDGPEYADGPILVFGSDPYYLDSEGDGVACESC
jgi:endonuclease YncB( thermonuclease family)